MLLARYFQAMCYPAIDVVLLWHACVNFGPQHFIPYAYKISKH